MTKILMYRMLKSYSYQRKVTSKHFYSSEKPQHSKRKISRECKVFGKILTKHTKLFLFRFEMPYNIWCDGCKNHIGMGKF